MSLPTCQHYNVTMARSSPPPSGLRPNSSCLHSRDPSSKLYKPANCSSKSVISNSSNESRLRSIWLNSKRINPSRRIPKRWGSKCMRRCMMIRWGRRSRGIQKSSRRKSCRLCLPKMEISGNVMRAGLSFFSNNMIIRIIPHSPYRCLSISTPRNWLLISTPIGSLLESRNSWFSLN